MEITAAYMRPGNGFEMSSFPNQFGFDHTLSVQADDIIHRESTGYHNIELTMNEQQAFDLFDLLNLSLYGKCKCTDNKPCDFH